MPSNVEKLPKELQLLFKDYKDTPISRSIARRFGLAIPNELKSAESVMEWLESLPKIELLPTAKSSDPSFTGTAPHRNATATAPPPPTATVNFALEMSRVEYGRVGYSSNQTGSGNIRMPEAELRRILSEHDDDINSAIDEVMDWLENEGESILDFDDHETNYDDYRSNGTEDASIDNSHHVRDHIESVLRSYLPEDNDDDYDGDGDDDE